jgi:drug/metabolite transporter (DMT)-like permease
MLWEEREIGAPAPNRGLYVENRVAIFVALATVYIVWGSTYLAIRFAIVTIPPFLMNGTRFLCAAVLLLAVALARRTPLPTVRQALNAGLIGALMLACGVGGTGFAELHVRSGLAAVVVASVPLWAALFSGVWGHWPNRLETIGLAVGLVGVGLLNLDGGLSGNPLYAVIVLCAACCFALGSVLGTHIDLPQGAMASAFEMLGGGLLLTVAGLFTEHWDGELTAKSALSWLYLVVFGSLITWSAFVYLLARVRSATATSYAYVNPVIAVILGALLAGEAVSPIEIAAMAVILAGVALVLAGRPRTLSPTA